MNDNKFKYDPNKKTLLIYVSLTDMKRQTADEVIMKLYEYYDVEDLNLIIAPRSQDNMIGITEVKFLDNNGNSDINEELESKLKVLSTPDFSDIDKMNIDEDLKSIFKKEFRNIQINKVIG